MGNKQTTSIKIDPELWKQVKLQAVKEDKTISKFVEEAIKSKLSK